MNKEGKNTFLDTIANYALVIRADLDTIDEIKKEINHYPSVEIVYQKYSFDKLYIKEDGDADDSQE